MTGSFRWGASSQIGLVRKVNEDSKLADPPVFAVADGMGGHSSGDVASAIAVEVLGEQMRHADSLADAVHSANRAIFQRAAKDPELTGMGTTITALMVKDGAAKIAHVGDSRAYLLRGGSLTRLTQDHTVVNRLVQQGRIPPEDADRHPQRSYLERALGVDPEVEVDVHVLDMEPGDRVLLCSDGLFGMIEDELIRTVLAQEADPQQAADRLCDEAVDAGGNDNVTCVVVDYPQTDPRASEPRSAPVRAAAPGGLRTDTGPMPTPSDTGQAAPARSGPVRVSSSTSRPQRGGWGRILIWAAVVGAIVALGLFMAKLTINSSWYVGVDEGNVAVFNGVPGSFAGFELSELSDRTELASTKLPELYQGRLEEGIRASSEEDASGIVEDLQKLIPTPVPPPEDAGSAPSPPPAAEPET